MQMIASEPKKKRQAVEHKSTRLICGINYVISVCGYSHRDPEEPLMTI